MGKVHDLIRVHGSAEALGSAQTAKDRRLARIASDMLAEEDSQALGITYSGFCLTALPHKQLPDDQIWERTTRHISLLIEPTRVHGRGEPRCLGVPYGSRARLILLYLQTEALRTGSREVELGNSMRGWLARVGIPAGGMTGKSVRDQAERISRCKLTFDIATGGRSSGLVQQTIVDRALFIEADDGITQERLSLETAKLSEGFFEQLKKHPVPLEEAAIKALSNNAPVLDVYLWLAYRLHALTSNRLVPWAALKAQFGTGFSKLYHFKNKFPGTLALAAAVYPGAKVEVTDEGVLLKCSRPPVAPRLLSSR